MLCLVILTTKRPRPRTRAADRIFWLALRRVWPRWKEALVIINRRRFAKPGAVLDRWLAGYANAVRPRLLIGRYRTQDKDPQELEHRIEDLLQKDAKWAWGGGAAAMRLTQHYRGDTTVLHVANPPADLPRRLRAQRDADGPFVPLKVPGRVAFDGVLPRTVHPLLVYTELLTAGDERAREAALGIRQRYLEELP